MHPIARIAAVAASLVLMGHEDCGPPSFEHPLSAPGSSRPDPRLIGTWYGTCFGEEDHRCFLHVFPRDADRLSVTLVQTDGSYTDAFSFASSVSRIGDRTYLDVGLAEKREDPAAMYLIVRYEIAKDGTLRLRLMRTDPVRRAGTAGELAWTEQRPEGREVADVTSPTPVVAAFVARSDEKTLFEPFGTFRRVRLPDPRDRRRR